MLATTPRVENPFQLEANTITIIIIVIIRDEL
jgi:hypothetical protein